MIKKFAYFFVSCFMVLSISSCYKNEQAAYLNILVRVLDETGEKLSQEACEKLKYEFINDGKTETHLVTKYAKEASFLFDIDLGYAHTEPELKKLMSTYAERLKKSSFKIIDSSGIYRNKELSPLPETGYEIRRRYLGYPSLIEYIIKLEKK